MLATVALLACHPLPDEVTLIGVVDTSHSDDAPLAGAEVAVLATSGSVYATAITGADGSFRVLAPAGEEIFARVDGEGLVAATFYGVSGLNEEFYVGDGLLYGVEHAFLEAEEQFLEGCPSVGEGAAVLGEVRAQDWVDAETGEYPTVTEAVVTVTDVDGVEHSACYTDPATGLYAPELEVTGETGRFFVPGLPEGPVVIDIAYIVLASEPSTATFTGWAPAEGVAPFYPAFVPLMF